MGTTLTYGHYVPASGETGFWNELEDNIAIDDSHTHNGVNSPVLTPASIATEAQDITSAGWSSVSGGIYSQTVTLDASLQYDSVLIQFRDTTTKEVLYLTCVKASATSYTLYSNSNELNVTAYYL